MNVLDVVILFQHQPPDEGPWLNTWRRMSENGLEGLEMGRWFTDMAVAGGTVLVLVSLLVLAWALVRRASRAGMSAVGVKASDRSAAISSWGPLEWKKSAHGGWENEFGEIHVGDGDPNDPAVKRANERAARQLRKERQGSRGYSDKYVRTGRGHKYLPGVRF